MPEWEQDLIKLMELGTRFRNNWNEFTYDQQMEFVTKGEMVFNCLLRGMDDPAKTFLNELEKMVNKIA